LITSAEIKSIFAWTFQTLRRRRVNARTAAACRRRVLKHHVLVQLLGAGTPLEHDSVAMRSSPKLPTRA
jgi:hypothetical protein